MAKRQPLVKTNGILFMKNREEHVLEQFGIYENYENCAEQAFTRSEIVQGMCYILCFRISMWESSEFLFILGQFFEIKKFNAFFNENYISGHKIVLNIQRGWLSDW